MATNAATKEYTEMLERGIKDLFSSVKYSSYLKTMSKFHNYSTRNTLLIHMQMPGASLVAGYKKWKNEFERNVKKGEHGIRIFAPVKSTAKKEVTKIDPETEMPLIGEDGKLLTEEVEVTIPRFITVPVFDLSQTEGKPLPQLVEDLTGDVRQYDAFMEALASVSPLPIEFAMLPAGMDGLCRYGDKIFICEGLSEIQTVSAVVHEIAHARLHDIDALREQDPKTKPKDSLTKEVEAESVSYTVCQHFKIETGVNSFGYIAEWSGGRELPELKASLETIRKTAAELIDVIDEKFREILKKRGIELAVEELNNDNLAVEVTVQPAQEQDALSVVVKKDAAEIALEASLAVKNAVDLEYMAEISGFDRETLINELKGKIYLNFGTGPYYVTAEEFLTGDLEYKLEMVRAANKTLGDNDVTFAGYAEALEKAIAEKAHIEKPYFLSEQRSIDPNEVFDKYTELLKGRLLKDDAYITARKNGDPQEVKAASRAAIDRIVSGMLFNERMDLDASHEHLDLLICNNDVPKFAKRLVDYVNEKANEDLEVSAMNYTSALLTSEESPKDGAFQEAVVPIEEDLSAEEIKEIEALFANPASRPSQLSDNEPERNEQEEREFDGPMPDHEIDISERDLFGYKYNGMLPLLNTRALELFDADHTIYLLYPDNTEVMAFEREDILNHDGIFGIETEEWEESREFAEMSNETRSNEAARESYLIYSKEDTYGVYMLKDDEELHYHRFASIEQLKSDGLSIDRTNYELVYVAPLSEGETLDGIYTKLNDNERPDDYNSRSLSISDIIVLQKYGVVSSHYVDNIGFEELSSFLGNERAPEFAGPTVAELEEKANAGQAISILDLANAVKNEREKPVQPVKKPSILGQLQTNKSAASQGKDFGKNTPKRDINRGLDNG